MEARCKVCPLPGLACQRFNGQRLTQCRDCNHFEECHNRRKHKYGAKTKFVDGHRFASRAEARRYQELKLLQAAGKIRNLRLQPSYPLTAPKGGMTLEEASQQPLGGHVVEVCKYVADFEYEEYVETPGKLNIQSNAVSWRSSRMTQCSWRTVTEDVKGVRTPLYKLKAKWFAACYGREVREIRARASSTSRKSKEDLR